ncbi:MAG: PD-(D/E)XK nuclease family protein, partial [Muribaculaceae bacterium]|nr:PD-(D/E)XK nuclease family protein [Muribaculaceae bacterium]
LYRLTVKYGVTMNESTYFSLFERLLSAKRIDLHGSPLKGLQIMGVLETRALDFNRVIIMSMNERIFPKRNYLRTMIPDSLRRAYCLGTESEAEAAYSYYFYRTVTGAKEVKLLYDNRSASLGAGETSRFISQLRHLHSEQNIIYSSINLSSDSYNNREIIIEKDNTILELLNEFKAGGRLNLSASALKTYLSCPLKFYLLYVRRLSEAIEVTPYLRASDYGTVVHSVMEYLYKPYEGMYVTADDINSILNRNGFVTDAVQAVMSDYMNQDRKKKNLPPRKLNTESLILCRVIEHFVRNVLVNELDAYCRPKFRYICAERQIVSPPAWAITPDLSINFKMFIDRIDEIHPGCLRFIDYKTGTDAVSAPNIPALFKDYSYGAIFQLLLYCEAYAAMVDATADIQPVVYNFTTITASQKLEPVRIGKTELLNYKVVSAEFMPLLRNMIQEIFNPDIPFCQCRQNSFSSTCTHCPFTD